MRQFWECCVVYFNQRHINNPKGVLEMPISKNELTKEQILKAMQCENAEELMALAKAEGFDITKAEAEAYMAELADIELENGMLKNVAGGCLVAAENGVCYAVGGCAWHV